jgi:hypothetical protein
MLDERALFLEMQTCCAGCQHRARCLSYRRSNANLHLSIVAILSFFFPKTHVDISTLSTYTDMVYPIVRTAIWLLWKDERDAIREVAGTSAFAQPSDVIRLETGQYDRPKH